ncbi:hypothetical protein H7Y63_03285 [Polaromonas sp.]|nr:hypothetical protein [Candidatus Saccharibacteria bacterium]
MQMESTKLQQTARTSQQNAAAKPTALPALHTISQPDLPILNNEAVPTPDQSDEQATPRNSKSAKDELPIGPSSRGASDALQGVKRDMANDKNSQLQATRQSVKLDQLHL